MENPSVPAVNNMLLPFHVLTIQLNNLYMVQTMFPPRLLKSIPIPSCPYEIYKAQF